jgi:hypothetical protein
MILSGGPVRRHFKRLGRIIAVAFLATLITSTCTFAQPPGPFDEAIKDLLAKRKAAADAALAVKAAEDALRAGLKEATDKLRAAGITIEPPKPDPAPDPKPVDTLAAKLKAAFEADKGIISDAKQLAALYRQAAVIVKAKDVSSSNELLRRVREAAGTLIGADALTTLRTAVAAELAASFGGAPSDAALTDAQRAVTETLFLKVAAILEGF